MGKHTLGFPAHLYPSFIPLNAVSERVMMDVAVQTDPVPDAPLENAPELSVDATEIVSEPEPLVDIKEE
jgi:hypothetical protein